MNDELLQSLAWLSVLGIGAQWLAWRLKLPSILLLLGIGFLAGPVLHLIDPDKMLGDLLLPFVSVAVSLILFEGGLTLKFSELKDIGHVVRNLVTIGAAVTFAGATLSANYFLGWSTGLAAVFGAIVVVTGPTVIGPLLRLVQPSRQVSTVLKWESIVIDPVGAVLALLVFEAVHAGHGIGGLLGAESLKGFGRTIGVGVVLGVLGGESLKQVFRRYWVPDYLQSPLSLMAVVGLFTLSNHFQHESGLLTVTLMGIWLANQKQVDISEIVEFKETLRVLLISILFVLLAARIKFVDLDNLRLLGAVGFLLAMLFVVRPVSVFLSCVGSRLTLKERLFLSWMAPRGIVAAAVASIFAIRLADAGLERAEELVPVTFFFIIGTVAIYGLTAGPVARALGVSFPDPQGILFVGATPLARMIARVLRKDGVTVMLMDTNRENLMKARMEELPTHFGNALSEHTLEHLELVGIGRLLAMTPNPEVNSLAAQHYTELFGKSEVYRLATESSVGQKGDRFESALKGRVLFGEKCGHVELSCRVSAGATVKKTLLTEQFDFAKFRERYGDGCLPLMLIGPNGELKVMTANHPPQPSKGWTVVSLLMPETTAAETGGAVADGKGV
jgi:NhaP-type Na+/H+ or K+/H+ antiporter